jgi:hypothetical protein
MLKARVGNLYILGIDEGNVERLKKGHPIVLSLAEIGGTDDVMIMYGDILEDVEDELEEFFGPIYTSQSGATRQ